MIQTPNPQPTSSSSSGSGLSRLTRIFRLSHQHTTSSATVLLGLFALLSRVIGLVRDKYTAYTFGAGPSMDAYNVAFQLPDLINYLLIGGAASISFVTILSRYRESGQDREGDRALSVILNTMLLVLGGAILLAELFVPVYSGFFFKDNPAQAALCSEMTRILLPGQLFFFAGGVLASVALVRKQFGYQAISPLVYTLGIIFGGLLFSRTLGVTSLAVGALAGAIAGPFLVNAYAAKRAGVRYEAVLDFGNPGLRAWVKMSLPLMLGVTVVFMDSIVLTWFAKGKAGDISMLMYAKRLFTAPMAIVGQAAGAASFPFFASLFSRNMHADYRAAVNRAVTRILSVSLLLSAAMFALAKPGVDLVFRGGSFHRDAAATTALYFGVFSVSLALWAVQSIYARAFFAAGETRAPMIAGTVITVVSLPIYWLLHREFGAMGLAWASNTAILIQTVTLAVMAHRRYLVPLFGPAGGVGWGEAGRALMAAGFSFVAMVVVLRVVPGQGTYVGDVAALVVGGAVWVGVCYGVLKGSGSGLVSRST